MILLAACLIITLLACALLRDAGRDDAQPWE